MDNKPHNLNDEGWRKDLLSIEMHDLWTKIHDDVITDFEVARFNRLMSTSADARQHYLRSVLINQMLIDSVGKRDRVEAESLGIHVDSTGIASDEHSALPVGQTELVQRNKNDSKQTLRFWIGTIAATLLIGATGASIWFQDISSGPIPVVARGSGESSPHLASSLTATSNTLVSYVSNSVRWDSPNDAQSTGSHVTVGQRIQIDEGAVELTYDSGTKLLLIAPADFVVHDAGGQLARGGLIASVPEAGHGFTIVTPNGKVVDLGTEFGLAVDDFGVSEVSVFEGKVEAFPITADRDGKEKVELIKGDSLQWEQGGVTELSADLRKFATSILGKDIDVPDSGFSSVDRFRKAIDAEKWKSFGDANFSESGFAIKSAKDADDRPYLVSVKQFDPLKGPVTVTCDFRFNDFDADEAPSFSIMTRSSDDRGTAFVPWNGILGSCVCCSFGVESETQQSVLQTSVKLGSENLMSTVSWGGFLPPKPNTRYRLAMRDDGVNVSFTVSLHEDPSTQKTVTCRSLFQSKTNHIALGGLVDGSATIDRVLVTQDLSPAKLSNYKDFCSLLQSDPAQLELERELLDSLVPENATLVLQGDFPRSFDLEKWSTLGEVSVIDSAAKLGEPNETGLIDTWKARPYLLTREPLNTDEGTITVIGSMAFSENFLSGYGATFAVMTRANTQRGDGDGWENSILQRGVRTTFWPAAANSEHSLEIHEKTSANTITLLSTQGVDVDPFVRNYVFRVIDDGESVELTVFDPKNPDKKMQVSSKTASALKSGFVGIECCSGSPIKLDEVRVYQNNLNANGSDE